MSMKYESHCCECGARILLEENEVDSSYDHLCKDCVKQYIYEDDNIVIRFAKRNKKAKTLLVKGSYTNYKDLIEENK